MGIKLAIHAGLAFISGLLVVRTKEHEIDITESSDTLSGYTYECTG